MSHKKKEIDVSNFYYDDNKLWDRLKAKASGTYVYDEKEFNEKNKNIKIVSFSMGPK